MTATRHIVHPAGGLVLTFLLVTSLCTAVLAADPTVAGHPGYLVVSGAADSTSGYRWQAGPGPDQRSLVWDQGLLTLPADTELETFGPQDLAVATGAGLTGTSGGGALVFAEGRYGISSPLLLTDGVVSFYAAGGEIEIVGQRIRYTPPARIQPKGPDAGLIFLAGMVILVLVMLRLARRRARSGPSA